MQNAFYSIFCSRNIDKLLARIFDSIWGMFPSYTQTKIHTQTENLCRRFTFVHIPIKNYIRGYDAFIQGLATNRKCTQNATYCIICIYSYNSYESQNLLLHYSIYLYFIFYRVTQSCLYNVKYVQ